MNGACEHSPDECWPCRWEREEREDAEARARLRGSA